MQDKKYHNQKTIYNGIVYDSKKEAKRAWELDLLVRAGKIRDLKRQDKFILLEEYYNNKGEKIRPITYIADFTYYDVENDDWVAEDTKGVRTEVYKIKKKLFEQRYQEWVFNEI